MTELIDSKQQQIQLENPIRHHFEAFIFGNASYYQEQMGDHPPMVEYGEAVGKELVICGAGPSLRDHAKDYCSPERDVWGCNSAATWLYDNKHLVTHAFTVDQTPEMLTEWASAPPVEYLLASSVHCHLLEFLLSRNRRVKLFHNYVGIQRPPVSWEGRTMPYEDWLYALLYPSSCRAGSGLNATTRAIDVGFYAGYEKIYVLGGDCAIRTSRPRPKSPLGSREHRKWLERHTEMHANGANAIASGATPHTMEGEIDGRNWTTKPDMMITAVFMVAMKQHYGDRLELIGDTLPNALKDKPQEYLDKLPSLIADDGRPIRYQAPIDA